MPELHVSELEEYGAGTVKVTLPVPGRSGKPLVAEIEAATLEELVPLMKGVQGLGSEDTSIPRGDPLDVTLDFVRKQGDAARPLIERFVRHPLISFDGPEPGKVEWTKLHLINRLALVNAISEFAQTGSVRRAERLATFLVDDAGGGSDGGASGGAVGNGRATVAEVPIAS